GQFVTQYLLAVWSVRVVLARCKIQMGASREGQRADGRRLRARVDADVREAGAEARFHLLTHGRWQWLPAAVATVRNSARNMNGVAVANPLHDGTLMRGMWRRPGLLIHSPRSSHLRLRHPLEMRRLVFEVCRDVLTLGARRRRDGVRV